MAIQINKFAFGPFGNIDRQQLLTLLRTRLPGWMALILVVAIAWQSAHIVWALVPGSPLGETIEAVPLSVTNSGDHANSSSLGNVQSIANAHLFGEASVEVAEVIPQGPIENLAETRLALTLKGIIAGSDDSMSFAIIADNRDEEKIYAIDDAVVPGTKLHAVYTEQVVLNRSGNLEALKLPKEFPKSSSPVRRNQTASRRATSTNSRSNSGSIQNVLAQNVTKLADVIRPTPYFKGGQQQGYRVFPGRDRKKFALLGLRPGDLIKDIDGAALTDPQQAMKIFENLGTADQVSVTVERNGQPQVLILSTSQLNLDDDK
ncbi:MAG: type II secretion system protein GspC [Gammaproteobacteria bacterium]|nr:type II secretion system protein GspC [Gammaproteobacteria bacterium]